MQREIDEKARQQEHIENLKNEVKALKDDLLATVYDKHEADKNAELLNSLYQNKIIDKDGNLVS